MRFASIAPIAVAVTTVVADFLPQEGDFASELYDDDYTADSLWYGDVVPTPTLSKSRPSATSVEAKAEAKRTSSSATTASAKLSSTFSISRYSRDPSTSNYPPVQSTRFITVTKSAWRSGVSSSPSAYSTSSATVLAGPLADEKYASSLSSTVSQHPVSAIRSGYGSAEWSSSSTSSMSTEHNAKFRSSSYYPTSTVMLYGRHYVPRSSSSATSSSSTSSAIPYGYAAAYSPSSATTDGWSSTTADAVIASSTSSALNFAQTSVFAYYKPSNASSADPIVASSTSSASYYAQKSPAAYYKPANTSSTDAVVANSTSSAPHYAQSSVVAYYKPANTSSTVLSSSASSVISSSWAALPKVTSSAGYNIASVSSTPTSSMTPSYVASAEEVAPTSTVAGAAHSEGHHLYNARAAAVFPGKIFDELPAVKDDDEAAAPEYGSGQGMAKPSATYTSNGSAWPTGGFTSAPAKGGNTVAEEYLRKTRRNKAQRSSSTDSPWGRMFKW